MWQIAMLGVFLLLVEVQDHSSIQVGEDRLRSVDGPARPLAESQLSAHPNNPNQLLAVVIQFESPDGGPGTCGVWASFDGGQQWIRRPLPIQGCFNPWSVILPDGSAVTVMGGRVAGHEDNRFLLRSPDGGRTWPDYWLGLGAHNDHAMVVAQGNQVYVVSGGGIRNSANRHRDTVSVVHSQDGGKTFGPPTQVVRRELRALTGHSDAVNGVAVSVDGAGDFCL